MDQTTDNTNKQKLEEMRQAIGVMAETGIIFFRAALEAGATMEETVKLTQAYMAAVMFGNNGAAAPEAE